MAVIFPAFGTSRSRRRFVLLPPEDKISSLLTEAEMPYQIVPNRDQTSSSSITVRTLHLDLVVARTVSSWNQTVTWLQEMDLLRHAGVLRVA